MMLVIRMLARRASWCAAMALACGAAAVAKADEPKCATCPSAASTSQEDIWLARLPMVGRLFKNVHVGPGPAGCAEAFERIGIDFEFCPPPPGFAHVWQFSGLGCPCEDCVCCPCAGKCGNVNCTASHCGAAACTAANCNLAACSEAKCGCENCPANQSLQHVDHLISAAHPIRELSRLFEHIAELSADKAAAEAALEVRAEAHEQFVEFFESMAELVAENAALEAKLAAQIEHGKLADSAIQRFATTPWIQDQVRFAVNHTADMYYRFFDVYQTY